MSWIFSIHVIMIEQRITLLRQALNDTPSEFARRIGDKLQRVQDIERGKQRAPSALLAKIVEHTQVNPMWLLTGKGEMLLPACPTPRLLSGREQALLAHFRHLSPAQQAATEQLLGTIASVQQPLNRYEHEG